MGFWTHFETMLNPFPIQFLALFAYFFLRVIVGMVLLSFAHTHFSHRHELAAHFRLKVWPFGLFAAWYLVLVEIIVALMFLLGFYTQIASLITIVLLIKLHLLLRRNARDLLPTPTTTVLLIACSCSLFITGAGAFAFDLPI